MKKIIGMGVLVFSLCFAFTVHAQQKIAVVSLQKALNEVEEGKKAKASIQTEMDTKKKQLESLKTEVKKMRDDLEKQKMVLSKEALETKAGEIQSKFIDLQQKAVQFEQELKQKEAESVQKILVAFKPIVAEIGKSSGYDLVIENSADVVLYSANATDITPELIKRYNAAPKK